MRELQRRCCVLWCWARRCRGTAARKYCGVAVRRCAVLGAQVLRGYDAQVLGTKRRCRGMLRASQLHPQVDRLSGYGAQVADDVADWKI
ncbi:photosystem I P700 chlorophyll a apoprotein A2 [Iris pallida]|uniref:Photosystem I P700 chlorophyll a apoprotein A2 (Plastid) n=1 Tax=Iris pallida TaxID=29817 RepID=A0AAX6EDP4_IRIPA|nr:photosystem I P700 chlorophyll a apoprotein A2 [Iris pallida]